MRQIGALPDEHSAQRFEDYLLTVGIPASTEANGQAWSVWVYDEDAVGRAREELAKFVANPDAPQYHDVGRAAADLREQSVRKTLAARRKVVNVREEWRRPVTSRCPVTMGLLLLSLLVAVGSSFGKERAPFIDRLSIANFDNWAMHHDLHEVFQGEIWRLVTPIFVHFGILHVLFNI